MQSIACLFDDIQSPIYKYGALFDISLICGALALTSWTVFLIRPTATVQPVEKLDTTCRTRLALATFCAFWPRLK